MRFPRAAIAVSLFLCACTTTVIVPGRSEISQKIDDSSAHITIRRFADDGSNAGGVVEYLHEKEEPLARAAAERFCAGPVRVKEISYLPTLEPAKNLAARMGQAFFIPISEFRKREGKLTFDCDRAAPPEAAEAYRAKFAVPLKVERGIGDTLLDRIYTTHLSTDSPRGENVDNPK